MSTRWVAPIAVLITAVVLAAPAAAYGEADTAPVFNKGGNTARSAPDVPQDGVPNVVVLVSDDQAEGTLDVMPNVRALRDAGVAMTTGIIPTSLCCPSRSALLSGKLAHTTGVYKNLGSHGGWPTFFGSGAEADTFAVALDNAGYRTGLFGKYLNGYALADDTYVPPGWDEFRAIYDPDGKPALAAGAYYNYILHGTGVDEAHGDAPRDYSTDVLTDQAVDFINATPNDQPFLLFYSTTGPHAPFIPAPRHEGLWHTEKLPPSVLTLTKRRAAFWPDRTVDYDKMQNRLQAHHEALMSVDEGVGRIVDAVGGRAPDTLFVYLSDNGLQFGEHGLRLLKGVPFGASTEVPMFLRWDGHIPAGSKDDQPFRNIDLTTTILDATNTTVSNPEGVGYFQPDRPTGVVLEAAKSPEHPAYCGWRTSRYLFVEYDGVARRELFDYVKDPYELVNRATKGSYANRLAEFRQQAISACDPTPPGFDW
ncbi:MAG: sulfatase-like hydrolase/transferase [Actinomycetes bacterium]